MTLKKDPEQSRRKLLKSMVLGGGVVATTSTLPNKWTKPAVNSVFLPVHAVTTGCLNCGGATTNQTDTGPACPDSNEGDDNKIRLDFDGASSCTVAEVTTGESIADTIVRFDTDDTCDGEVFDMGNNGANWDFIDSNAPSPDNQPSGDYWLIMERIAGGNVGKYFRVDFTMDVSVSGTTITMTASSVTICEVFPT